MARTYCIYKLDNPREQVGMPGTHKWAVGVRYDGQSHFGFVDAFRTKRGARDFINQQGACILCGEVLETGRPSGARCACERANLEG